MPASTSRMTAKILLVWTLVMVLQVFLWVGGFAEIEFFLTNGRLTWIGSLLADGIAAFWTLMVLGNALPVQRELSLVRCLKFCAAGLLCYSIGCLIVIEEIPMETISNNLYLILNLLDMPFWVSIQLFSIGQFSLASSAGTARSARANQLKRQSLILAATWILLQILNFYFARQFENGTDAPERNKLLAIFYGAFFVLGLYTAICALFLLHAESGDDATLGTP